MSHLINKSTTRSLALLALAWSASEMWAEIPVDHWANPVLATADLVVGPLVEAAKTASGMYTDYSRLAAYTTIQYYKSTETSKRGTTPFQAYQTTVTESGVDPRNGTTLIDRKTVYSFDSNGKLTTTVDATPFLISKIGSLHTKCQKLGSDGRLVSSLELEVEPTLINVHVDISRFSTYSIKNPKYVFVQMVDAADLITDCNLGNKATTWTQVTRVNPGVQNIVPFSGKNLLTHTAWPRIDIGYSYNPSNK